MTDQSWRLRNLATNLDLPALDANALRMVLPIAALHFFGSAAGIFPLPKPRSNAATPRVIASAVTGAGAKSCCPRSLDF